MANEKERVDPYLDTISRLEPDIAMIDANTGWASIAISLKRIADALKPWMQANEIGDDPNPGYPPVLTNEDFIAASRHLANVTNAPADHAAETVRVVFQAVRWAREGKAQTDEPVLHEENKPPDPLASAPFAELEKAFNEAQSDPLDVAARAILEVRNPAGLFDTLDMNVARAFADAAIRAYEAIPDSYWTKERAARDPSIRPEPIINYAAMPPAEMLARVGTDAMKWAEAFCQTAYKLGIVIDDEAWMAGWFANAIEAGSLSHHNRLCAECDRLRRRTES